MARNDWFRRTTWSAADQDAFFERLERSRGSARKAQYARIQAVHLERTGKPELVQASLALLDRILAEWPADFELATVHWQRARCYAALDRVGDAIGSFRDSFEAEAASTGPKTGAWKDFMWLIATHKLVELYPDALALTSAEDLLFPVDRFLGHGAKALISEERGHHSEASQSAALAVAAAQEDKSGFRYHPDLGLVGPKYASVVEQLQRLAER